jgi:cell division protein FtsA
MSRAMLVSIIAPRVEEILTLARDELVRSRTLDSVSAGVVLTGGGASMPGMAEITEEIFALPVRIGAPREATPGDGLGLGPKYATAVGLAHYALERTRRAELMDGEGGPWAQRTSGRIREWLQGIF